MPNVFKGVTVVEIVLGRFGLHGRRNKNLIPIGGSLLLRNVTLEDDSYRTGGGAVKLGDPIPCPGV